MTPKISGVIEGSGADTALVDLITPVSPRVSSAGSVVADILANSPSLQMIIVVIAASGVFSGAVHAGPDAATLTVTGNATTKAEFAPTGTVRTLEDWRSSLTTTNLTGFTAGSLTDTVAGSTALGAIVADVIDPEELSYSLGAFVDAIDRAAQTRDFANDMLILIDQDAATVEIHCANGGTFSISGATASFTRTLVSASGAQWGE